MSVSTRFSAGSRLLAVGLSAALAVAGVAVLSGTSAKATPPPRRLATATVGQAGTGTIKGKLVWGGTEAPTQKVLQSKGNATKDPAVCAATADILDQSLVVDPKTLGVEWGIAYLVRPNGENPEAVKDLSSKKVVIDQKGLRVPTHAVALHQDQDVVLKSSDPVVHNVHLSGFTNAFNFALPPNSQATKKLVAEKRAMPLNCDLHTGMKSWVMVFDHPFFAVTKTDGSFEIKGVPAGVQNLVIFQESVGYANPGLARGMKVEVAAGKTTDVGEIKIDPAKVK